MSQLRSIRFFWDCDSKLYQFLYQNELKHSTKAIFLGGGPSFHDREIKSCTHFWWYPFTFLFSFFCQRKCFLTYILKVWINMSSSRFEDAVYFLLRLAESVILFCSNGIYSLYLEGIKSIFSRFTIKSPIPAHHTINLQSRNVLRNNVSSTS